MVFESLKHFMRNKSICDSCLGRQFAQLSTGLANRERGRVIRFLLSEDRDIPPEKIDFKKILKTEKPPETRTRCDVCRGFFNNLERWKDMALKKLKGIEFYSFAVGTMMSSDLIEREENLWEEIGIEHTEPLKSEANRELGKILEKSLRKKVDERNPDINILINFRKNRIDLKINPAYFYGRYMKLARGIPQTRLEGYSITIEDIIAKPFIRKTHGKEYSFHGLGREDIDARCLDWRPFVIEISEPRKRKIDLKKIQAEINRSSKIQVRALRISNRKEVVRVKEMNPDKSYRLLVRFEKNVDENDLKKIKKIKLVRQKTPSRVLQSRADKTRGKRVKAIKWRRINNKSIEFQIKGEAGLYIKELVSGDRGRTSPSFAGVLKNPARARELDVVKIHMRK